MSSSSPLNRTVTNNFTTSSSSSQEEDLNSSIKRTPVGDFLHHYHHHQHGRLTKSSQYKMTQTTTPTSLKLARKNPPAGPPVRYSASMTPPPCLLRKLRHEASLPRTRKEDILRWRSLSDGRFSSSRSSLSTLTDEPPNGLIPSLESNDCSKNLESSLQRKLPKAIVQRYETHSLTSSPIISERKIRKSRGGTYIQHGLGGRSMESGEKFSQNKLAKLELMVGSLEEKVGHLSVAMTSRQILATLKEIKELKEDVKVLCESARAGKKSLENITEEAAALLNFLREIAESQTGHGICFFCSQQSKTLSRNGSKSKSLEDEIVLHQTQTKTEYAASRNHHHQGKKKRGSTEEESSIELTSSDNDSRSIIEKDLYHKT